MIAAAIDKAMAFDAEDRQRSIAEFREMLGWDEQKPTVPAPKLAESAKPQSADIPRQMPPAMEPKSHSPLRCLLPLGGAAAVAAIVLLAFNPFGAKAPDTNVVVQPQKPEVVTPPVAPKQQVKAPEPEKAPPPKVETPPPPKTDSLENARRDFEAVQRVNTMQAYEHFLQQYPDGLYATLAREAVKRLAMLENAKLNRALNAELKRVGCGTGASDGQWGDDSERALALFNQHAQTNFETKLASTDALDAVRAKPQRVCPLVCGPNQRAKGDACVAAVPSPAQTPPPATKQDQPKKKEQKQQAAPGGNRWCMSQPFGPPNCGFTSQAQCEGAKPDVRTTCRPGFNR
ncbi:MAG: hypothetical protein KF794_01680 [Xanthobacteraceae bacterium]|nr:hypothetical protein [Xanthobacteraceae bacterium]QYK45450.1 MAG: hypothetical protein KF794_01680 [Xanthobacteraceae bacterium]